MIIRTQIYFSDQDSLLQDMWYNRDGKETVEIQLVFLDHVCLGT